ncbi:MAG: SPASM domain-containing protein [Treponema sp.]|nr:SPASM domain-containing protein [Treponema sp.]
MKKRGFHPDEIIFSATTACNLHCEHCFINRSPKKLEIESAKNFLLSCIEARGKTGSDGTSLPQIERIGFSGGEPFMYMDFILELTKLAVENDLLFDQIVTNGDWWRNEDDLCQNLQTLYDAGYDGKFALSWDSYHNQNTERMLTFISAVQELFGQDSINIQRVTEGIEGGEGLPLARTSLLATPSAGGSAPRNAPHPQEIPDIPVHTLPRTFPSEDARAWQARRWFKEDYCQGPGNILYIHADGNIAPCCGFANENPELFIGNIKDSFEEIMRKASENRMVKICYQEGLSHYRRHGLKKTLRSQKKRLPGKCSDICSFCDFVCKSIS